MLYVLNGISYGMLLFIVAASFTIILGTLGELNIAHGAFYVLAVYIAYSTIISTGNFFLALLAAGAALGLLGIIVQGFLLNRFPLQQGPQVLVTYALVLIVTEGCKLIWGATPLVLPIPDFLTGYVQIEDFVFPIYRIWLIGAGSIIAALLWLFQERTKWGALGRALRDDAEMAQGIGINVRLVWVVLFGLGMLLVGLAGGIGGHFLPAKLSLVWQIMLMCFVVIAMGGIGSLKGAFVASMFIGILDNVGRALFPELAMFLIFASLAIVLAIRPLGFFGKPLLIAGKPV